MRFTKMLWCHSQPPLARVDRPAHRARVHTSVVPRRAIDAVVPIRIKPAGRSQRGVCVLASGPRGRTWITTNR